jgi:hypothetical protein
MRDRQVIGLEQPRGPEAFDVRPRYFYCNDEDSGFQGVAALAVKTAEGVRGAAAQPLDGMTLFRFAHMMRSATSGGVEAYLCQLNRVLLQRNRMRILQNVPDARWRFG